MDMKKYLLMAGALAVIVIGVFSAEYFWFTQFLDEPIAGDQSIWVLSPGNTLPPWDEPIAGGPGIRVSLPESKIELGSEVKIKIEKSSIPANAGIVLYLVREKSDSNMGNMGWPLMLRPQIIEGNWEEEFIWNGKWVGCAPSDVPTWCEWMRVGKYYIKATVYDRHDFPILGDFESSDVGDVDVIAEYNTDTFLIDGPLDFSPLTESMGNKNYLFLSEEVGFYAFGQAYQSDKLLRTKGGISKKSWGIFCLEQELLEPFSWTISTCTNKSIISDAWLNFDIYKDFESTGTIIYASTLTYQEALSKAQLLAYDLDPSGAKEWEKTRNPWEHVGLSNWTYRVDGKYWMFVLTRHYLKTPTLFIRVDDSTSKSCITNFGNLFSGSFECSVQ